MDLALNNLQKLICHKTKPNHVIHLSLWTFPGRYWWIYMAAIIYWFVCKTQSKVTKIPNAPNHNQSTNQKWCNLQKAKREHFKRLWDVNLTPKANTNQEDHNTYFTKTLLTIAKSSTQPKFDKPWYNNECKKVVRVCCAALRKFKTNPTKENLEFFKNCRARAWRTN